VKFYLYINIFLVLWLNSLSFAETFTYEKILKLAIENSPILKAKSYDVEISSLSYKQSYANILPQFSVSNRVERFENLTETTGFITVGGQVIGGQPDEWRTTIYLTEEYYLSNWYKKLPEINYYEKLKEHLIFDCYSELKRLIKDVLNSYSALIEAQIKLNYSNMILNQLKEIQSLKKSMYEKGEISYEEILKTEAEIEAMLKEQTELTRQYRIALLKISELTGRKFSHEDTFQEIELKGNFKLVEPDIETFPEFKAQLKQKEAQEERLKIAKRNFLPDVVLYTRYDLYGSSYYNFRETLDNLRKTAFTAGIFLTMPIFDGGRLYWEKQKAFLELKKHEERIRQVKQEKSREIQSFCLSYTELKNTLKRYENLMKYYQKILDIAEKAYTLGEKSKLEILETKKDIASIQRDVKVTENSLANLEKKLEIEINGEFRAYGEYCSYKH
jgi:outer membrane protein TolC